MTILGVILIVLALTIVPSHLMLVVGVILAVLGFCWGGYGYVGGRTIYGRRHLW